MGEVKTDTKLGLISETDVVCAQQLYIRCSEFRDSKSIKERYLRRKTRPRIAL